MAEFVLTIALETVENLLTEEPPFLLGVIDELKEIGEELKRMKPCVEYVSKNERESIRKDILKLEEEIREVAEEVDDVLKNFAKEVASRKRLRLRSRGKKIDDLKRLACFFNNHTSVRKKWSEVLSAKKKITDLSCRLAPYDFRNKPDSVGMSKLYLITELGRPGNRPVFEFITTAGMEEDISKLVFQLVNNEETQYCCQVVSICGMPGVGKSTLARKLYNHAEVQRCFDCVYSTSLKSKPRQALENICLQLVSAVNESEVEAMTEPQLCHKIYQVLEEKKCLIVLEDIWTAGEWDSLRDAFQMAGKSKTGSKVLLTTGNKKVALHADPNGYLYEVNFFTEEEGFDLLQKTLRGLKRYMRTERYMRTGTKKNVKIIEQASASASAETINRTYEVPESSHTVQSFREHVSTEIVGPDGPDDKFSKPSRQYDAIKRANEEQAAKIEKMEEEIKIWKSSNDYLREKKVQNLTVALMVVMVCLVIVVMACFFLGLLYVFGGFRMACLVMVVIACFLLGLFHVLDGFQIPW